MTSGAPPLGAHWDGAAVHFAIWSSLATAVELRLFDAQGRESAGGALESDAHQVWRVTVPGLEPGHRYGYRVHGPWRPAHGLRCNPAKLLVDPYALALDGSLRWDSAVLGHRSGAVSEPDDRDSAPFVPRSMVVDRAFDWGNDRPPGVPWSDTVIYEAHVKGLTVRHPDVPVALRGTYRAVAAPAMLEHYRRLGVTTIELLPIHHSVSERHLLTRGLTNYWGYNTLGFFAPDQRFASDPSAAVVEFKAMVRDLHRAGLEVLLDVVYNHTAEGPADGPTLSFRGIDNPAYYRLDPAHPGAYVNYTGCGNTLDITQPRALALVLDSLRYWVTDMHVDGFRFDLAPVLARGADGQFDSRAAFFDALARDPVLRHVKVIAEPWDAGPDGYRLGRFPAPWREWNGAYRDAVRSFWRGDADRARDLTTRMFGSPDLFGAATDRGSLHTVNYVAAHDGFTLRDVVSYAEKHNEANGEQNRDGESASFSWNNGHEGPTDDPETLERRARLQRALLATLVLSRGVPMLCAGDELDRTQEGNNNAYCQDNETSWLNWSLTERARALLAYTAELFALRRRWLAHWAPAVAVNWFAADGTPSEVSPAARAFAVQISAGEARLIALINSGSEAVTFGGPVERTVPGLSVEIITS